MALHVSAATETEKHKWKTSLSIRVHVGENFLTEMYKLGFTRGSIDARTATGHGTLVSMGAIQKTPTQSN